MAEPLPQPPVLIIDCDTSSRGLCIEKLQAGGFACIAASTISAARELLKTDRTIRVVLADFYIGDETFAALVPELKRTRPDVLLVGNSDSDRAALFAFLGVSEFLARPWDVTEFRQVLARRRSDVSHRELIPVL